MPPIRLVLDTNVVVSAHLSGAGYSALVVDLCLSSRLDWYVSHEILTEYKEVLRRPKFRLDASAVRASIKLIRKKTTLTHPRQRLTVCPDPEDNKFLECAFEARADYVVTGNKRHFPPRLRKTRVVSPREMIEIITPELQR